MTDFLAIVYFTLVVALGSLIAKIVWWGVLTYVLP